jgi:transposase
MMVEGEIEETVEAEEVLARVAAIDVAKATGMVCLRVPAKAVGRRTQQVWNVGATSNEILELADRLAGAGVQRVVMEATGVYWKPWFYLLESRGLTCWLVNARDVKNVPGRPKTDKLDAIWLAKLNERGMLRASFVPPKPVRHLRDLTRARTVLTEDRTRVRQRVNALLEDAQLKLSSFITDLFGVTGRRIMDALVAGTYEPHRLADLADHRIRAPRRDLVEALTGNFEAHHGFLLRVYLETEDHLSTEIDALTTRITSILAETQDPRGPQGGGHLDQLVERLDDVPGIAERAAQIILAEIGWDMSRFPTADHLASWSKLTPRTIQSGGKAGSGPTGKGNPWLKGILGEAAQAAANTKGSFFAARYKRLAKRKGHNKAIVAVARSLLVVIWHLINDPDARYTELGADWHERHLDPERKTQRLVRELRTLGHDVTLTPRPLPDAA